MKRLKAPWRAKYFARQKPTQCAFCVAPNAAEDSARILYRASHCYIIANKHPYSYGHIMVIPYEHKRFLDEISLETWTQMSHLVRVCERALREAIGASGVNIGMNLGEVAGASIAAHMHYHLVPRWFGDTNFMTTIGNVRVLGADESDICAKLSAKISQLVELGGGLA